MTPILKYQKDIKIKLEPLMFFFFGKLPSISTKLIVNKHRQARDNEENSQEYRESYSDSRRKRKENVLTVEDSVVVKQQRQDKLTIRYNDAHYVVTGR